MDSFENLTIVGINLVILPLSRGFFHSFLMGFRFILEFNVKFNGELDKFAD
jgi:hypothetical protein